MEEPTRQSATPGLRPAAAPRRLGLLINEGAGSVPAEDAAAFGERARRLLASRGARVSTHVTAPDELLPALERMAGDDALDAVIVAGGDGSVSAAAEVLAGSGKALGVLPSGTLNLLARQLGIDLDIDEAARQLAGAEAVPMDLGKINGRRFALHASLGAHPWMVRRRDRMEPESRRDKLMFTARMALRALRSAPPIEARIDTGGGPFAVRSRIIVVTVGVVERGLGTMFVRRSLTDGKLVLYRSRNAGGVGLVRSLLEATFTAWHRLEGLAAVASERITIETPHSPIPVALDGEVVALESPLELRILPAALRVLRPRA